MPDQIIDKIAAKFDPVEELSAGDTRYVDCGSARHTPFLIEALRRGVESSTGKSCQLFCGYTGSGKSTELNVLLATLATASPHPFIVRCDANASLNLSDVSFDDILLVIVQELWQSCSAVGIGLESPKLVQLITDLYNTLKLDLKLSKLELPLLMSKITWEIRNSDINREIVRGHLRSKRATLLDSVNELLVDALIKLRQRFSGDYNRLLIIIDNLDRIWPDPTGIGDYITHERLFVAHAHQFRSLKCDLLLTIPSTLLHSSTVGPSLASHYGHAPIMLPSIPIRNRDGSENPSGIAAMEAIIKARCETLGVNVKDVFDSPSTMSLLVRMSGGFVRRLISSVRDATNYVDYLPITQDAATTAISAPRDDFIRAIKSESDWEELVRVSRTKRLWDEKRGLTFLRNTAVYEYKDDDGPWYEVNPLITSHRYFQEENARYGEYNKTP